MAISKQEIQSYVNDLKATGLSGLELEKAINSAAKQYGVTDNQLSSALGYSKAEIDQWRNKYDPVTNTAPTEPDWMQEAKAGTRMAMNYRPQQVQAQNVDPALIRDQDLSQYMNPYTQEVIDRSMADMERARQMQMNNLGFSASQAGAFGGSRHGVAEGVTNEGFARQAGNLAANLNQQNFSQAMQTAGMDVGAMNNMGQFNAQQGMQAGLANQAAGLQGAQLNLGAANQMGQLGNLGFTQQRTINQDMFNQGIAQQQLNQQAINNAMTQYTNWANSPVGGVQLLGQALQPGTGQGTTTQGQSPGMFDWASLFAMYKGG